MTKNINQNTSLNSVNTPAIMDVDTLKSHRFPRTIALLPTYRCTAACDNCCFGSHISVEGRIPLERLLQYLDQAKAMGSVSSIVISGGEPFLLGNDLDALVAHAKFHGFNVRIVTNGYWAISLHSAKTRLLRLFEAGLDELNFSTGDYHLKFIPFERVFWGTKAAIQIGMRVAIAVEHSANQKFNIDNLLVHHGFREILDNKELSHQLTILEVPWIRRGSAIQGDGNRHVEAGPLIKQDPKVLLTRDNLNLRGACNNVLNSLAITPYERVSACCGLPSEEIPELDLGSVKEEGLANLYKKGRVDFIKLWLAIEGPEHILSWAASYDPTIEWEGLYGHQCESCRAIYQNPKVSAVIREHYTEKLPDVLLRFVALDKSDFNP